MEKIISQIFKSDRKLTKEEIDSLKGYNVIDAGGVLGVYSNYHLHVDSLTDSEKSELKERLGLEFIETRVYGIEDKF
ncbi:hypothetical protein HYT56_00160 [Candidatus Woesearchaeota archaeon]|nr:hypothetical protein [Candidatus Woesearchaeota archaeon]